MNLCDLPIQERPRERLLQYGVDALSLTELLAILLSTGTKGKSVLHLAQEILAKFGSVERLLEASVAELCEVKGVGKAKAIQLRAAFGIALKTARTGAQDKLPLTATLAYELVKHELVSQKQEILLVILKDIKGKLITYEKIALGTLSEVLVHPREVFYPAVRHKAHSFILVHNHPSGDPTPSEADLELTRHLLKSSQVMGIGLDDHLIIGNERFISLREAEYF